MKNLKLVSLLCLLSTMASTVASEQQNSLKEEALRTAISAKNKTPLQILFDPSHPLMVALEKCVELIKEDEKAKQRNLDQEIIQLRERCGY